MVRGRGRRDGREAGGRSGSLRCHRVVEGCGSRRGLLARLRRAVNAPGKDGSVLCGARLRSSTGCVRRVRAACGHAVHESLVRNTRVWQMKRPKFYT